MLINTLHNIILDIVKEYNLDIILAAEADLKTDWINETARVIMFYGNNTNWEKYYVGLNEPYEWLPTVERFVGYNHVRNDIIKYLYMQGYINGIVNVNYGEITWEELKRKNYPIFLINTTFK